MLDPIYVMIIRNQYDPKYIKRWLGEVHLNIISGYLWVVEFGAFLFFHVFILILSLMRTFFILTISMYYFYRLKTEKLFFQRAITHVFFAICITLGKLAYLSVPQFPPL